MTFDRRSPRSGCSEIRRYNFVDGDAAFFGAAIGTHVMLDAQLAALSIVAAALALVVVVVAGAASGAFFAGFRSSGPRSIVCSVFDVQPVTHTRF